MAIIFYVNMLEATTLFNTSAEALESASYRRIYMPETQRELTFKHGDSFTLSSNETAYFKRLIDNGQLQYITYSRVDDSSGGSGDEGDTTPPTAPSNLRLAAGGNDSPGDFLIIEWDAPTDEGTSPITTYKIFYRFLFDSDFTEFVHPDNTDTSITITDLTAGFGYIVYVVAVSNDGESDPSDEVTLFTWAPN